MYPEVVVERAAVPRRPWDLGKSGLEPAKRPWRRLGMSNGRGTRA